MPKIHLLVPPVWLLRCALPVNNNFEACASPVPSDIHVCVWIFLWRFTCVAVYLCKTLVCMTLISMWGVFQLQYLDLPFVRKISAFSTIKGLPKGRTFTDLEHPGIRMTVSIGSMVLDEHPTSWRSRLNFLEILLISRLWAPGRSL